MDDVFSAKDLGEFARREGKRFEEGARAYGALLANAEKLGIDYLLSRGQKLILTGSFLEWEIDPYLLVICHETRRQYWGLGRRSLELLQKFQVELKQRNELLKNQAG